jgi:aminocarboxymuconate-semialdehyde decarboxylase
LIFSHGGGGFAQVLPRLQHAWTFMPSLQAACGDSPTNLAKRLYFDSLVYSPVALRFLIAQFGASRICIGTDYPFAILDRTPVANIASLVLDAQDERAICSENLLGLLRGAD